MPPTRTRNGSALADQMTIRKLMILFWHLIIKLTFMLQASKLKTLGKKKQLCKVESEESNDEGCDPDSERSFILAALDTQSFICKITLRVIKAAISHIGHAGELQPTKEL